MLTHDRIVLHGLLCFWHLRGSAGCCCRVAAVAVEQHDHLLRQYLADFYGYEVTTEVC
jgi:hypothetical protein